MPASFGLTRHIKQPIVPHDEVLHTYLVLTECRKDILSNEDELQQGGTDTITGTLEMGA